MSKKVPYHVTLETRDACLCFLAQRTARLLGRRFDEALRPYGLTNGQFSLLMSLNRPEPPSLGPVAELLAMDRTTLTAALKPLERAGLVKVASDEKDRRTRRLILTDRGHEVLLAALPSWRETHEAIGTGQAEAAEALRGLLAAMRPRPGAEARPGEDQAVMSTSRVSDPSSSEISVTTPMTER